MMAGTPAAVFLVITAPTMGDTTSSAIVSAPDISAVAIPLADFMAVDFTVVDSMAAAVTDRLG